jgi:hypothetical protein
MKTLSYELRFGFALMLLEWALRIIPRDRGVELATTLLPLQEIWKTQ